MLAAHRAPTPKDTVFREGRGSVYRFRRTDDEAARSGSHVPVLLVPSMLHRWYVLDLCEGSSVASALSRQAPWETYLFDWGVPEDEDRYVTWDDIVARLDRVVRFVQRTTGAPKVALVGYSLGATLSAIYGALHPGSVAALVNLSGPFDFSKACLASTLVDPRWFDAEAVTAGGNVSALQMHMGFFALAPLHGLARLVRLADAHDDAQALASLTALETWVADAIPFPGSAYVTYVKELYQQNQLVRGEHYVRGQRVDLGRITCPVLSIVSDADGVCPAESTTALNDACGAEVKDVLRLRGGHVSAVVGPRAATDLYPPVVQWLERHATAGAARTPESKL